MYPLGHRVSEMSSTGITKGLLEDDENDLVDCNLVCSRVSAFIAPRVNLEPNMTV
jgi:hypothetical protein